MTASKLEIRNRSAAKTTNIQFVNWFAAHNLFRIPSFGFILIPALCAAATVPINNPSFETTDSTPVAGWGVQPPGTDGANGGEEAFIYSPTTADYPGGIPGGKNVAHSDGPIIFQDIGALVQPDTQYSLSIFVGNSAVTDDFVDYRAVLVADGLVITQDQTKPIPAPGTFVEATSTGYVGDDPELVGYPISVVLEPLGGQVDWDEAIPSNDQPNLPEPALAGMAIAAPLVIRRRRRS